MTKKPLIAAATLIISISIGMASAFAQEVYRCKNRDGKIEFRDFPCEGAASRATPGTQGQTAPRSDHQNFDPRTGLPTDRVVYERMLDACVDLLKKNPKARNTQQWSTMRCDRIEEFEIWREKNSSGSSGVFTVDSAVNDELFVIAGKKFKAKTYCFGILPGTRVKFLEGSPASACTSAKIVDLNRDQVCSLWCE